MIALSSLASAFRAIRNDDDLDVLVKSFGLSAASSGKYGNVRNLIAAYEGREDGIEVVLIHRWHDPSQAFSIQPDINKLELHIGDSHPLTNEYPD